MANTFFTGYSARRGTSALHNQDIVNQDLLNALYMRVGEDNMEPQRGCSVWNIIFEVQSPGVQQEITDTITAIVAEEPRVILQNLQIITQDHGYAVILTLYYNALKTVGQLQANFNNA